MLIKQTKSYFRFMGPQPITLNKDNLKIAHPDSIVKQYCVTEKADGERYELFIFDKKGYLINAKQSVIEIPLNFEKFSENGYLMENTLQEINKTDLSNYSKHLMYIMLVTQHLNQYINILL